MTKLDPLALPAPPIIADLSGFPLLRLDQLPCLDTETLVQSVAFLRKQLGGEGEEPVHDPLFCRVYARRQVEAMAQELQRREVQICQPLVEEKSPSLPSAAVSPSAKDAHVKTTATAYPPLIPLARFVKAEMLDSPQSPAPISPPPVHFVIRSSRPKLSIRGGRSSRAIARARMQQYKAWRLEEEGEEEQTDTREPDSDDKSATIPSPPLSSLPPAPLLSALFPPPPPSLPSTAPPAEDAPPPPPSPSPPPLLAPAPSTPPPPPPYILAPSSPPVSLPREAPLFQAPDADDEEIEEPSHTNSCTVTVTRTQLHFRLGTSSSRPEVQSIVADVFADVFPDWRRWPGEAQDDDDDDRSTDISPCMPQDETWHLLWTWSKPRVEYASLLAHQHVNHIPRSRELTRKDLLVRHLTRHLA